MPTERGPRLFSPTEVANFRAEGARLTRRFSSGRRFLRLIADIMEGTRQPSLYVTLEDTGIVLESATRKHWPLVQVVCDEVPGLRSSELEFGIYYGIRRSAPRA